MQQLFPFGETLKHVVTWGQKTLVCSILVDFYVFFDGERFLSSLDKLSYVFCVFKGKTYVKQIFMRVSTILSLERANIQFKSPILKLMMLTPMPEVLCYKTLLLTCTTVVIV